MTPHAPHAPSSDARTPGSPEAIAGGCTCDPALNADGRGAGPSASTGGAAEGRPLFVADNDCPLHGIAALLIALPPEPGDETPEPADDEPVPNPMVAD